MQTNILLKQIEEANVAPGRMTAWWLGGSGFVLKNDGGATLYIDAYLSNSAEEIFGLQRAFLAPIAPKEARPDLVVATHWHEDHLDPGTIPVFARTCKNARFIMPPSAASHAVSWGVPRGSIDLLMPGCRIEAHGFTVAHVPARHEAGIAGWETPDAMGVVISTKSAAFYHSGDTEYYAEICRTLGEPLDVVTTCINGATGNMDAKEAALLASRLQARIVVPHHHLLWSSDSANDLAGRAPEAFQRTYEALGGQGRVLLPHVGEEIAV